MSHEISQRFFFEAAHTLQREVEVPGSARVHGHTYQAEVSVAGVPDVRTGMVMDIALLRSRIEEVRAQLDHHLLDEVAGLGAPTLENLCSYIAGQLSTCPGLSSVRVWRDASGDSCTLRLGEAR
jgi:6-pyruvoyltetrahydropterin/6-carboxytetrahydropterin synthase